MQHCYVIDFDPSFFWKWTDIRSYAEFTCVLLIISTTYALMYREREFYIEPLGYLALMTEAVLGIPQIIKNYQNHSTEGMK